MSPLGSLLAGATSGVLSSLTTFPIDLLRRRFQIYTVDNKPHIQCDYLFLF
jgi:hypothetical protein